MLKTKNEKFSLIIHKHLPPYTQILKKMSQDDTGAYRCTDIEQNRLIGSTQMIGMNNRLSDQFQKQRFLTKTRKDPN
jgi:hypothetical protein